jgi:hypothetical protein
MTAMSAIRSESNGSLLAAVAVTMAVVVATGAGKAAPERRISIMAPMAATSTTR